MWRRRSARWISRLRCRDCVTLSSEYSDHAADRGAAPLDSASLMDHLTRVGLAAEAAQALSAVPYPLTASASPDAMPAEAEAGWWHIFGLMHRSRLEEEVAAAMRDLAEHADDAAQRRLIALCTARNALRQGDEGADVDPADAPPARAR